MKITNVNTECLDEAADIAFEQYEKECQKVAVISNCSKETLKAQMKDAFQQQNGFAYYENNEMVGYLVYDGTWDDNGTTWCNIPLWGYGAVNLDRMKIISMLFQTLAEKLFGHQKLHFQVKVYAHDKEAIKLFSFLQFGIECEECMRQVDDEIPDAKGSDVKESNAQVLNVQIHNVKNPDVRNSDMVMTSIRELTKAEVKENWNELWELLKALVTHLQKSPVFYPGTEFTEEVYKEFLVDESTRVVVTEMDGQLIGLITANKDGNCFINSGDDYYNVGDVYLKPQYRGSKLAQGMLKYLSDVLAAEGVKKQWVEHGTANPNARGFWNKYFSTYAYTMIRDIEPF